MAGRKQNTSNLVLLGRTPPPHLHRPFPHHSFWTVDLPYTGIYAQIPLFLSNILLFYNKTKAKAKARGKSKEKKGMRILLILKKNSNNSAFPLRINLFFLPTQSFSFLSLLSFLSTYSYCFNDNVFLGFDTTYSN